MPTHGIFVANRLDAFRQKYDAEVKVIAPVPWFPFREEVFGAYGRWARAPKKEWQNGVEVFHPRYFVPPKMAMRFAPKALTNCLRQSVSQLIDDGWDFDLIDAHYFYPDGVAAACIAREFDKRLVITARGTDVNLLPDFAGLGRAILNAANRADAIVTVAAALKDALVRIGAQGEKITVLRNGVDLELFQQTDRETARRALGLDGLVIASVGHLIERKGHDLAIKALADLPDSSLLIVGEGPERASLARLVKDCGVGERVKFLGHVPHEELPDIYSAADVLVLASSREGWPNVLLEAMACGTPCVASDVWGSGEVIRSRDAGHLLSERSASAIADSVASLAKKLPERTSVRAYAERHSWNETAEGMAAIFNDLLAKHRAREKTVCTSVDLMQESYRPRLIVTVDTEEQFDWSEFDKVEYSVPEMSGVESFQTLCAELDVRPLYFLTWPFLNDEPTAQYFVGLKRAGDADCGLHLHQWTTPPGDFMGEFFSFQKNLPRNAHREKLKTLADAFDDVFGARAVSHRAGRYGIAPEDYEMLAEIGVKHDFSPSAAFDFSARGGPDFSGMSNHAFKMGERGSEIFVTPVCGARAIPRTRTFLSAHGAKPGFSQASQGWLHRRSIPLRLSPEGAALADLKALTKRLIADRTPVLTFTLHSTSLHAGGNDYAPDQMQVDRLLADTAAYFRWFREAMQGEILSLDELAALYAAA